MCSPGFLCENLTRRRGPGGMAGPSLAEPRLLGGGEGLEKCLRTTCSLFQEFLQDQSDCRILPRHVNRPSFLVVVRGEAVFAVLHWRKALQLLENKAFPCCIQILSQSIVRLVGEFGVTDSVCHRPKSGSPGCESQRLRRIPHRLSLKPSTGPSLSRYPNFCHWLKLQVSTLDSEKVVLWERSWHWQVFYDLTESLSAIEFIARDVPYLLRLRV